MREQLARCLPFACALGIGVAAAFAPTPAQACSCGHFGVFGHAPLDGATGVATDVRLLQDLGFDPSDLRDRPAYLLGPSGETIDIEWRAIQEAQLTTNVGFLSEELEPHTTYEVFSTSGPEPLRSFTTGSGPAETPAVPAEVDRKGRYHDGPGDDVGPSCTQNVAYVFIVLEYDPGLVLITTDPSSFDGERLEGSVNGISASEHLQIGRAACTNNWDGAGPGASTPIYIAVLDGNGHFSGWEALDDVQIPRASACTVNPDADAPWSWLALLLLFARRRRP